MSVARRILPDAPARRGWCPSLARPMPTGDGLLARIHPPLGVLTSLQARAVADGARRFGNGHIDVTARANLQIRGVTEATRSSLEALFAGVGLGDIRADGGPQRLTLTPPMAGPEVVALARAIEAKGLAIPDLPAKALVAIGEFEPLLRPVLALNPGSPSADSPGVRERAGRLTATDADIRLLIIQDDTTPFPGRAERQRSTIRSPAGEVAQRHDSEPLTRPVVALGPGSPSADPSGVRERAAGVMVAGSIALALAGSAGPEWFALMAPRDAVVAVDAALRTLAASGARRMRDLPAAERGGLVRRLGLAALSERPKVQAPPSCGLADLGDGRTILLDAPFGRCDAGAFDRLADQADVLASDIHLSPTRGFALVAADIAAARDVRDHLSRYGFITRADDPRGAVAACPGAPACASGSTATLADADRLAHAFRTFAAHGLRAHVSGCAKGCAHPAAADLTLVGDDGLYGIVFGGPPSALPTMRLTFEAALERLRKADPSHALAHAFRIES